MRARFSRTVITNRELQFILGVISGSAGQAYERMRGKKEAESEDGSVERANEPITRSQLPFSSSNLIAVNPSRGSHRQKTQTSKKKDSPS